jgi:hypothetical protein
LDTSLLSCPSFCAFPFSSPLRSFNIFFRSPGALSFPSAHHACVHMYMHACVYAHINALA